MWKEKKIGNLDQGFLVNLFEYFNMQTDYYRVNLVINKNNLTRIK